MKTDKKKEFAKLIIDGEEHIINKRSIFDLSKREYKIKENNKKINKGEVAILFLRESGIAELKYVRPENDMFIINGNYYHTKGTCIYNIGKKRIPLAVIPEWSFVPLSRKNYEEKLGSKYQEAQRLIIKSMENAEIVKINQEDPNKKKKADTKTIVILVIIAIVGLYFLQKGFG